MPSINYDQLFSVPGRSLINWATPTFYRRQRWLAWMFALLHPDFELWAAFLGFRTAIKRQLSYNGQRISLERMLNLEYYGEWSAVVSNPIYLEEVFEEGRRGAYIYQRAEELPLYLYQRSEGPPIYIYPNEVIGKASVASFVVYVPASLSFDPDGMRRLIDRYRLAGVTYRITTY